MVTEKPDDFASRVSLLNDPELSGCWRRAIYQHHIAGTSPALVEAALDALTKWSAVPFGGPESIQMQAIEGATLTVTRCIVDAEDRSYVLSRKLGLLFHSKNIGVAFTAVRHFEVQIPSPLSMFVIDHLISVASSGDVPVSPNAMSLRAISFKVLFDLDSSFINFPSLATAVDECIIGCRAWALDGRQVYRDTLQRLLKYRAATKQQDNSPGLATIRF